MPTIHNRIPRIRSSLLSIFVLAAPFAGSSAVQNQSDRKAPTAANGAVRPNIVLILADDLGWTGLGCYGSDFHETPHLDRLARESVRFTDAYAASPVCSPTRAGILTGKHPARLGITIWSEGALTPPRNRPLLPAASEPALPHSEVTIAETLQAAGYLTALVGKWHLGDAGHYPETQGFDVNIGGTHWGAPPSYFHPYRGPFGQEKEFRYVPVLTFGQPGEYLTDRLTDEALEIIAAAGDQPFFLYLAHHAPHTPIEAKPELVAHYERKLKPGLRHHNPAYAAMIHSLDESVGRVLDALDQRGLADRTIVIFTSDNGGFIGEYGGQRVTDNAPLRSGKGSCYEGGVRVPMLIRWPGVTLRGGIYREPVILTDLHPTILEIALGRPPTATDGVSDCVSLTSLLRNPSAPLSREALFFHYPHYYATTTPVSAVRAGDWKLLEYFEDSHVELYNLRDDLGELRDLAKQQPDKAAELRQRLHAWRQQVGARLPTPNPSRQKPGATPSGR